MLAPRYFFSQNSLSIKPNNSGLISGGYYVILWHRLCFYKYFWPYTFCYHHYSEISSWTWFCLLVLSLLYLVLAVICEKCYRSSISLIALICKLASLVNVKLWKIWKILLLTCNFVWFWCICYLVKLSHSRNSF